MHMKLKTSRMIVTMAKEKMNLISTADFGEKMERELGVKLEVQSVEAAAGARKIARGCQVCIFVWPFPKSFLLELTALENGPKKLISCFMSVLFSNFLFGSYYGCIVDFLALVYQ